MPRVSRARESEANADGGFLQVARRGRPMVGPLWEKGACNVVGYVWCAPRLVSPPCAKPAPPYAPPFAAQITNTRPSSPLSSLFPLAFPLGLPSFCTARNTAIALLSFVLSLFTFDPPF